MGLDISAYRGLTKLDVVFNSDGELLDAATHLPITEYFKAYVNSDFPGRENWIEHGAVYSFTYHERVFSRSYSGYSRWRETLSKVAGYPPVHLGNGKFSHAAAAWENLVEPDAPFYELINFADNEGVIGPETAARLLRDFRAFDGRAKDTTDDDFYEGYCDMRRGLEIAADGGALDFH